MAQTGYTPILIYSSSTTSNTPAAGNLTNSTLGSELAINITDGKLFYKDNTNAVQVIAWKTTPTTAGGTGLTSYAAGDLLYYATGTTLSKLAIGASKTILTSSGTAPQWSVSLDTTQGGTGLTSYAAGDLPYFATGTALSKLGIGAANTILTSSGTAPQWSTASSISVGTATNLAGGAAGSVPYQSGAGATAFVSIGTAYQAFQVNAGGTAPSWQPSATSVLTTQGDLLYASAANTLARLAKNTSATRYLANTGTSNNPAWAQVDLTNGVTGTLPIANGGTNTTSFTAKSGNVAGIVFFDGTKLTNEATVSNFGWDATTTTFSTKNITGSNLAITTPNYSSAGSITNASDPNGNTLMTFTNGANVDGGIVGGGGYVLKLLDKTSNSGSGQTGYGLYVSSPYNGVNASGGKYALTKYGIYVDDIYNFYGNNSQTGASNWGIYIKGGGYNYIKAPLLIDYTTSNGAYSLQVNSQIFATSATIATSDGRYKENVKDLTNALDMVCALQPKTFTWKTGEHADGVRNPTYGKEIVEQTYVEVTLEDGTKTYQAQQQSRIDDREWLREPHNFNKGVTVGFIAQDVQQALSGTEFVDNIIKRNSRPAVMDKNGNEIAPESEFLGIAEGNLIAILAAAIKELKQELDDYKAAHP